MKFRAYAKINLGLHILGKRADGYHNIETVFRLIDLYDDLEIVQADEGTHFTCNNPELLNDNSNLCIRAANLLRDLTGTHMGAEISLTKRIPIAAGLGGGSTDAAAALTGLTKLWSLEISIEELRTISATLGSDVPFFFEGQSAYATGRGEILDPFNFDIPYSILVVTPRIRVSTSWAYSALTPNTKQKRPDLKALLAGSITDGETLSRELVNEFEEPVFRKYPEIRELKQTLLKEGAVFALMSGSGSSVFGFFREPATSLELGMRLSDRYFTSVSKPSFKPEFN
jgi:4-diphosphocytidyl-2-C-methyl-D-erythritol kinase